MGLQTRRHRSACIWLFFSSAVAGVLAACGAKLWSAAAAFCATSRRGAVGLLAASVPQFVDSSPAWAAARRRTRIDLFRGKVQTVQNGLDVYLFDIRSLVVVGIGRGPRDRLSVTDKECDPNCEASAALFRLSKLLGDGATDRRGEAIKRPSTAVDRNLVDPMYEITKSGTLDPDEAEEAEDIVTEFVLWVEALKVSAKDRKIADVKLAYEKGLEALNKFIDVCNKGISDQADESLELQKLPADGPSIEKSDFWKARLAAWQEASSPQAVFLRSQALTPGQAVASALVVLR